VKDTRVAAAAPTEVPGTSLATDACTSAWYAPGVDLDASRLGRPNPAGLFSETNPTLP